MKRLPYEVMLVLCLFAASVHAQETLVPFDSAGRVERLDRSLEDKLNLFPEFPRFVEAALFRLPDSSYVLEIMYDDSAGRLRARRPLTSDEASDLRWRVMQAIAERAPAVGLDQSGRKRFIAGNLALTLGYHGWAIPTALQAKESVAGGLYLVTAAAGYFIPLLATEHASVSRGTASLGLYGGSRGIAHGIMLGLVAGAEHNGPLLVGAGVLASIAEEVVAVNIARHANLSDGDAVAIGVLGDFGAGIGVGMADVSGAFDSDHAAAAGGWVLAGSAAGLATGGLLARNMDYTRGDAYVVRAAGALGALVTVTLTTYGDPKDDRVYSSTAIAGAVGGLALGHVLIRDHDFSSDQGALITLGEVSGGLLGIGLVTLAVGDHGAESSTYWTGTMLGAAGGFTFSYLLLEPDASLKPKHAPEMGMDIGPRLPSFAGAPGFERMPLPPDVLTATLKVHF
jgi:hypothetical protein